MKKFKVILSLLMVLVMAVSSIPVAFASENDAEYYEAYKEVLDYYYDYGVGTITPNINELKYGSSDMLMDVGGNIDNFGYMFQDYDGDGVKELFLGNPKDDLWYNGIVYQMFTIKDSSVVKVATSWNRAYYSYCGNGLMYSHGSNSAFSGFSSIGKYEDGSINSVEGVSYDLDPNNKYIIHSGVEVDKKDLSEDELNIKLDEYKGMIKKMDLIPLAQYPENYQKAVESNNKDTSVPDITEPDIPELDIPVPDILILGDSDFSGVVNVKDATRIQKQVAGLLEFTAEEMFLVSDADQNEKVNVKDATMIQKFVADIKVPNPVGEEISVSPAPLPVQKLDTKITIYFSNNQKWTKVNAYLYNEAEGTECATWPGQAMKLHSTNTYGEQIYMLDVDVSEFNRVVFNNGKSQSMNAALTVASSGFYIAKNTPKTSMALGVYAFDVADNGKQTTVKLDYPDGYQKPITIVTPNGYDPADTDKVYPVIYLLDGQNQFLGTKNGYGGWVTDKVATCLQANGHDGFILVGIDNSRNRDKELTPDIGDVVPAYKSGFENGKGEAFSDFVANTVMPYIQENYNVSLHPADNAIIGSSSGGIEAFYIGMEHMDKFGKIGAISPAFMLFDKAEWDKYLAKFDFSDAEKLPRIYFYNGGGDSLEKELNPYAKAMPEWMAKLGYPEEKMIFVHEDTFSHNEYAWRMIMPETIAWLYELQ